MFCSDIVPALTDLNLADNQLYDLNFEFECIKNLRLLDVSYNKLKRLSNRTMERIDTFFGQPKTSRDRSRTINMIANPYVCDCNMRPMFFWLNSSNANLHKRNEMRCYTGIPDINAGK